MCVMCIMIDKEKMTTREIARAYREQVMTTTDYKHMTEIMEKLQKKGLLDKVTEEMGDLDIEDNYDWGCTD